MLPSLERFAIIFFTKGTVNFEYPQKVKMLLWKLNLPLQHIAGTHYREKRGYIAQPALSILRLNKIQIFQVPDALFLLFLFLWRLKENSGVCDGIIFTVGDHNFIGSALRIY